MVFGTVMKLTQSKQNITIGVQKSGFGAFVSFLDRIGASFPGMVFGTVMKMTQTNQNITIGSKKLDWVRSFCLWSESMHHLVSGMNGCIKGTLAWFSAQ